MGLQNRFHVLQFCLSTDEETLAHVRSIEEIQAFAIL
jgi:hypothetical protein